MKLSRRKLLSGTAFGLAFVLFAAQFQSTLNALLGRIRSFFGIKPKRFGDRVVWAGFKSVVPIPAGDAATVWVEPRATFQPQRIVVPETLADHFVIESLHIAGVSQFQQSLPASVFVPSSDYDRLLLDTVIAGERMAFRVRNTSTEPRIFRAATNGPLVVL